MPEPEQASYPSSGSGHASTAESTEDAPEQKRRRVDEHDGSGGLGNGNDAPEIQFESVHESSESESQLEHDSDGSDGTPGDDISGRRGRGDGLNSPLTMDDGVDSEPTGTDTTSPSRSRFPSITWSTSLADIQRIVFEETNRSSVVTHQGRLRFQRQGRSRREPRTPISAPTPPPSPPSASQLPPSQLHAEEHGWWDSGDNQHDHYHYHGNHGWNGWTLGTSHRSWQSWESSNDWHGWWNTWRSSSSWNDTRDAWDVTWNSSDGRPWRQWHHEESMNVVPHTPEELLRADSPQPFTPLGTPPGPPPDSDVEVEATLLEPKRQNRGSRLCTIQ